MNDASNYVFYPDLVHFEGDEEGEERLQVSFSPSNGHRIQILNADLQHWASFDFASRDEIEAVAHQLLTIAKLEH